MINNKEVTDAYLFAVYNENKVSLEEMLYTYNYIKLGKSDPISFSHAE